MAFTFTTLKTAIQEYTDNTESTFTGQLSRFILNAEERILKECPLDDFVKMSPEQLLNQLNFSPNQRISWLLFL